jgi:hypothetical protein
LPESLKNQHIQYLFVLNEKSVYFFPVTLKRGHKMWECEAGAFFSGADVLFEKRKEFVT